jgi:elongation factor 2
MYSKKFGTDAKKLASKLWGEHYFNKETKKWSTSSVDSEGNQLERGFCHFILDPIFRIFSNVSNVEKLKPILDKLEVEISQDELELDSKKLLKLIMNRFLPAGDALVSLIVLQLPSPVTAQRYRLDSLYEGPHDDECAIAIRDCDPSGPVMIFISKMVPTSDKGRFYAMGRVFSGTVRAGMKVRIQGSDYVPGGKTDLTVKGIQRTVLMMGRSVETLEDCPAGNIVGLVGVDQYIVKTATLTTSDSAHNFKVMKFSVSPVVQVAVKPAHGADLPKLVDGLKMLSKADSMVHISMSEGGEHLVSGVGELHLEVVLKDLQEDFARCSLVVSNPIVNYRETVTTVSSKLALAKSTNKHNRIYLQVEPLDEILCSALESGKVDAQMDFKTRNTVLSEEYGWNLEEAKKIMTISGSCIFVDRTSSLPNLHQVKDLLITSFAQAITSGINSSEPLRGCKFSLVDANFHSDSAHRGGNQLMPMVRRAVAGACLLAEPGLVEPIYKVEISCGSDSLGGVHKVLNQRRGKIVSEDMVVGTPT